MKILFNGCSFTYGDGLHDRDHAMPTLVARHFGADYQNISQCGSSNREIFSRSANYLLDSHCDVMVVQWSALRRHWFEPGINQVYLSSIDTSKIKSDWTDPVTGYTIKQDQRRWLGQSLIALTGDYKELLELCLYCRLLDRLAMDKKVRLVFVNGLVPWQSDLLVDLDYHDPGSVLGEFTAEVLEWPKRAAEEVRFHHARLRTSLEPTQYLWVNLFDSWHARLCVDRTEIGYHPGVKSHRLMADLVIKYLVDHKILDAV